MSHQCERVRWRCERGTVNYDRSAPLGPVGHNRRPLAAVTLHVSLPSVSHSSNETCSVISSKRPAEDYGPAANEMIKPHTQTFALLHALTAYRHAHTNTHHGKQALRVSFILSQQGSVQLLSAPQLQPAHSSCTDDTKPCHVMSCHAVPCCAQSHLDAEQLVLALVVDHPVNLTAHNNVQVVGGVEGPAAVPGGGGKG